MIHDKPRKSLVIPITLACAAIFGIGVCCAYGSAFIAALGGVL